MKLEPLALPGVDTQRPIVIAGPCSAESEEQVMETAKGLADKGIKIFRAGIWKPRTKPGGFEGIGTLGLPWLKRVKQETGMLVATEVANKDHVFEALQAGASGFLLKDAPPEDLLSAVRTVHRGDAVMAPRATRRLLQHVSPLLGGDSPARRVELPEDLTPRELEVLVAMAHGLTNGEIAERFVLSAATVKTHVGRVLAKTGSRDRVQAVLFAFRAGLVRPDELLGTGE